MKLLALKTIVIAAFMVLMSCTDEELSPCEQIAIVAEQVGESASYTFTLSNELDSLELDWFINDDEIDVSNFEIEAGVWKVNFNPGNYTICINGEAPDCPAVVNFCVTIEVDEEDVKCNEVEFEVLERDAPGVYKFATNVEDEEAEFNWFINDILVGDSPGYFIYDFTAPDVDGLNAAPGEYNVCVAVTSPSCDLVREYCEVIEIGTLDLCPRLFFEAEQEGDLPVYTFFAEFEGRGDTQYKWYINDDVVDQENFDGTETDHKLYWQFGYGEYTVCIVNEDADCQEAEFCKVIEIPDPSGCPELNFTKEQLSDREYKFTADFEGIADLEYYAWLINDDIVEEEGTSNDGDNILNYTFPEAGEYNVCIITETPDCNEAEFCEKVTIQ